MSEWIFPTLSEILALNGELQTLASYAAAKEDHDARSTAQKQVRAEREWFGAIAALETLLHQSKPSDLQGLVLSGPLPVLSQPELLSRFKAWSFTADPLAILGGLPFRLPPADPANAPCGPEDTLSLIPGDPLATEPFCLVLTNQFSLVMVLGEDQTEEPAFIFSFDPDVVERVWQALRLRVVLMSPAHLKRLDDLYEQFPPIAPDYKVVTKFSHILLSHLPEPEPEKQVQERRTRFDTPTVDSESLKGIDVELLQAIAHEVRTPLTTIQTLTRLLLRRRDLPPDVIKRLEVIDRECREQINRFGLIFRAVEIETSATKVAAESLTPTSLAEVLEESIPRWQTQATQRNLTLDVILPQQLPPVVSDPTMLDQALTSLIDRSARSLPPGSQIQVEVSIAGHQLKLQLQSKLSDDHYLECDAIAAKARMPLLKSLGQVLMFQPETGTLSLNLSATKNLFHALGGKLIVRERPEEGEVFTLFLPLEPNRSASEVLS
jgi:hypothetical protein